MKIVYYYLILEVFASSLYFLSTHCNSYVSTKTFIYYISLKEIVNRCFFIFMAIFCEVSVKEAERFHSLTVCPVRRGKAAW